MIIDSFDDKTEALLSLEKIYGPKKHLVNVCIVTFSKEIYEFILNNYECVEIARIMACNGSYPIYKFNLDGKEIAFYLSMIGSTMAAQLAIEANWLTGADKFIMFGSAGTLDYDSTNGKFVVPTESYRDEGMSYHYKKASDYIEIKNHSIVTNIMKELEFPFVEGRIWTTDAMLRETAGLIKKRKEEGVIAVEMEIAGVESVADFYGFDLYTFIETGDVLTETSHDLAKLGSANNNINKFFVAIEIAKRI